MNVIDLQEVVIEKSRCNILGIGISKLTAFFHHIMEIASHNNMSWWGFHCFYYGLSWWKKREMVEPWCSSLNVEYGTSIGIVGQSHNDSHWWNSIKHSCLFEIRLSKVCFQSRGCYHFIELFIFHIFKSSFWKYCVCLSHQVPYSSLLAVPLNKRMQGRFSEINFCL